eukprot:CAMPEP_0172551284 /NCGR_PEP_ID=MMETSP1067-20121228/37674_1 /TAXON_ID=265564 ORGANISM="Thalassiosira punctigera, Strain Tpunct2005C2" /NCGR_SAMPLE_ID=MMETSP1067 /ASSEMBLY_ACC=CAM_ASM_000444 /LENGTH=31 /DNA_ID= /DNA_START= /DNA_END= /DNA_ORIENTATION=
MGWWLGTRSTTTQSHLDIHAGQKSDSWLEPE